jgi:hypothetical protein
VKPPAGIALFDSAATWRAYWHSCAANDSGPWGAVGHAPAGAGSEVFGDTGETQVFDVSKRFSANVTVPASLASKISPLIRSRHGNHLWSV